MRKIICLVLLVLNMSAYSQRNVVLIIADDLGTDYFGFYENHRDTAAFPNIRRLLAKGVRFTNAMSNPVCSPTRAGILTGRYSFRTGVGDAVGGQGSVSIDTSELSIPRILKQFNPAIQTANIGKWHLNLQNPTSNLLIPNKMGYDHYQGAFLGTLNSYTNWTKVTNGVSATTTNYATTETANDAITWIKGLDQDPFFLWLAFNAPHTPIHLPPAGLHSYTSLSGTANDINANPKEYFKATLEALDHEIGRVLDILISTGKMDNTDIIFVGDNGNGMRSSQNEIANRDKGTLYQYGVNVPLIISGPSVTNPNSTSHALVNTHDLFATIIELMGFSNWKNLIPTTKPIDSKSILTLLKDQDTTIRPWVFTEIFKATPDAEDGKAIRNTEYKLINFDDGRQEFYHLTNDPDELSNLLNNSLSSIQKSNYIYLCTEMATLIGSSDVCDQLVDTKEESAAVPKIKIYPNPTSDIIEIELNQALQYPINVGLFNMQGTQVEQISIGIGAKKITFDIGSIPAGIYYLKIGTTVEKMVIAR